MNKRELVSLVARDSEYSRREVQEVMTKTFDVILEHLSNGENVSIINFGLFKLKHHKPRRGYNPKTRKKIDVPEKISVTFSPTGKFEITTDSRET